MLITTFWTLQEIIQRITIQSFVRINNHQHGGTRKHIRMAEVSFYWADKNEIVKDCALWRKKGSFRDNVYSISDFLHILVISRLKFSLHFSILCDHWHWKKQETMMNAKCLSKFFSTFLVGLTTYIILISLVSQVKDRAFIKDYMWRISFRKP